MSAIRTRCFGLNQKHQMQASGLAISQQLNWTLQAKAALLAQMLTLLILLNIFCWPFPYFFLFPLPLCPLCPSWCPWVSAPHLHNPPRQTHAHASIAPPGLTLGLSLSSPTVQSNACSSCPCSPPQHSDQSRVSWSSVTACKAVPALLFKTWNIHLVRAPVCVPSKGICVCAHLKPPQMETRVSVFYREISRSCVELRIMRL